MQRICQCIFWGGERNGRSGHIHYSKGPCSNCIQTCSRILLLLILSVLILEMMLRKHHIHVVFWVLPQPSSQPSLQPGDFLRTILSKSQSEFLKTVLKLFLLLPVSYGQPYHLNTCNDLNYIQNKVIRHSWVKIKGVLQHDAAAVMIISTKLCQLSSCWEKERRRMFK